MSGKICFVIQPFSPPYEGRYETIYKPAIEKAGLTPRRVGRPGDDIITEEIEQGIKNAHACLAEITPDFTTMLEMGGKRIMYMHNPNVWYELGFAYACGKPVSMVCNEKVLPLSELPFDISTRYVNGYTDSVDSNKRERMGLIGEVAEDIQKKAEEYSSKLSAPSPQNNAGGINDFDKEVLKILVKIDLQKSNSTVMAEDVDVIPVITAKLNATTPAFDARAILAQWPHSSLSPVHEAPLAPPHIPNLSHPPTPKTHSAEKVKLSLRILRKNKYVSPAATGIYENYIPTDKAYEWYRENYERE